MSRHEALMMSAEGGPSPELCNCLAVRQAARHITQLYDQFLAPTKLRTTQLSILVRLRRSGPMTINALAEELLLDRTTLGRNIQPLRREGLIAIARGRVDRRSKEVSLTAEGVTRMRAAIKRWSAAQAQFEAAFGSRRTAELRGLMHAVVTSDLGSPATVPA
jgi:DNA-binding MarR family transcriptional regulator